MPVFFLCRCFTGVGRTNAGLGCKNADRGSGLRGGIGSLGFQYSLIAFKKDFIFLCFRCTGGALRLALELVLELVLGLVLDVILTRE